MIDELANLDGIDLPNAPLNLAGRIRELRARQGIKQSEIARRMGLDPSIPSLWEQGKRPVPSNRVPALAEALGVTLGELLEGIAPIEGGTQPATPLGRAVPSAVERTVLVDRPYRARPAAPERTPLLTLVSAIERTRLTDTAAEQPAEEPPAVPPARPFVPAERPSLVGWVPDGWEPSDRVQDIAPGLPDGYWLDPVKLEKPTAKALLQSRLCEADRALVGDREVPGAALAERLYRHCSKDAGFLSSRFPLSEAIFRAVLGADYGGLPIDALLEAFRDRGGAMPLTAQLLRRLRDSMRPYPIRWVDRELFG